MAARRPENSLGLRSTFKGRLGVAQQKVPPQLQNPVIAGDDGYPTLEHPSLERRFIDESGLARSPAKALDEKLHA
jgi:hypothetical protein